MQKNMRRRYLKDDIYVVSQKIQVLERELEGHCIRVEVGARLHEERIKRCVLFLMCQLEQYNHLHMHDI